MAQALSRPALIANALHLTTVLHMYLREPRLVQERAEAANAIAFEYGTPFELSYASFARGWALAQQGHLEEGIVEMRRTAKKPAESGFAARPRWFVYLAEACAKSEGPSVGLNLLAEGVALMECTGERMYEAELYRVKGELLLMQEPVNGPEAEHCFRTAIEVARRQAGKIVGIARDNQPRAIAQRAGPPRRSARDARRNLRLVHRGLRHRRFEGRQGAAR